MTRPASQPTWATSTNYPADATPEQSTATKVAPAADQTSYGWRPNAKPPAQKLNYWQSLVADWIAHLSDIASPKWLWLSASAAQIIPTNAPHGTITIGASAGFFGEVAQTNYCSLIMSLPVGTRLLQLGIRFRHATGEGAGGVIGAVTLFKHDAPVDGTDAANTPVVVQADPPASNPASNTLEVLGNSAAGAKWETVIVDLDQADAGTLMADKVSYTLVGMCSGTAVIESIGVQYQPYDS